MKYHSQYTSIPIEMAIGTMILNHDDKNKPMSYFKAYVKFCLYMKYQSRYTPIPIEIEMAINATLLNHDDKTKLM